MRRLVFFLTPRRRDSGVALVTALCTVAASAPAPAAPPAKPFGPTLVKAVQSKGGAEVGARLAGVPDVRP